MKTDPLSLLSNTLTAKQWKRIGIGRRAGIAIPLFSLFSHNSVGIGEYPDLKLLIKWCKSTYTTIIQLLPLNDTGYDFWPYDSQSSFALEPMYLSVSQLKTVNAKGLEKEHERLRQRFPSQEPLVDYGIKEAKLKILWGIFSEKADVEAKEFVRFQEGNAYWLKDYCLFKALKDHHHKRSWEEWPEPFRRHDAEALDAFSQKYSEEILFWAWLQWQIYEQFFSAKALAEKEGVLIKGDLPFLVSRDSADVWAHQEYFKLHLASGAPPDMYAAKGQRWGMPPYHWERIAKDGYVYLKERLKFAENFYDLFRIDHVVGIFRVWTIPVEQPWEDAGLNGRFDPAAEDSWEGHGRQLLSVMINSTTMLPCAEDLGAVPPVCPKVLKEFGIPGLEIQRWVKDWTGDCRFKNPKEYRAIAVACLSTHDTSNWADWWNCEAGTVDELLMQRKCQEKGIDFFAVREKLFSLSESGWGRLRWLDAVSSPEHLCQVLDRKKEDVPELVKLYRETYGEKTRVQHSLQIQGEVKEETSRELLEKVLEAVTALSCIFSIQLIFDWFFLTNLFIRPPYNQPYALRVNRPGTNLDSNWRVRIPMPLEEWSSRDFVGKVKAIVEMAGRHPSF